MPATPEKTIRVGGTFPATLFVCEKLNSRQLNGRSRKTLDFETLAERFEACAAMTD
jgi:hypothetical protein